MRDKFMTRVRRGGRRRQSAPSMLQAARKRRPEVRKDKAIQDSTRYANSRDRYHSEAVRDTLLRQVISFVASTRPVRLAARDGRSAARCRSTWLTSVGFTGTPQGANVVITHTAEDTSAAAKTAACRLDTEIPKT